MDHWDPVSRVKGGGPKRKTKRMGKGGGEVSKVFAYGSKWIRPNNRGSIGGPSEQCDQAGGHI